MHDAPDIDQAMTGALCRAHDRDRTGDLILTKDVLCRLSYVSVLHLRISERETGLEPATSSLEG